MTSINVELAPTRVRIVRSTRALRGVSIVDDIETFERIGEAWEELRSACEGGPFVGHSWTRSWWEAFGGTGRLCIAVKWRDGQLVAAAPLYVARQAVSPRLPMRVATGMMLSNHRTGFNEWLIEPADDTAATELLDVLLRDTGASLFELEPIRRGRSIDLLCSALKGRGAPHSVRVTLQSVVVDLADGWDGHLSRLPRMRRKAIRVADRRIAEQHGSVVIANPRNGAEIVERALALGRATWKGHAGTAVGSTAEGNLFLRRLWQLLGPAGGLEISLLAVGGEDVASTICLRDGKIGYAFASDFREDHAHLGPGRHLLCEWLRRCAANGVTKADLLRSTPFCRTFSEDTYELSRVVFSARRNIPWMCRSLEMLLAPIGRSYRIAHRRRTRRRAGHKPEVVFEQKDGKG
ncbi:GNAT family N-acetyltransferase [Mesorhizobium mediterraneum]|uniref:GNAT family N-acetyltransferase n=1 Tax=Mesorhizobium mediterraneum TaxID=43617 RepID=UPI00177ED271|nr:GNAT family N-acetyltransferase [Mesorhizobium mediterraneum]